MRPTIPFPPPSITNQQPLVQIPPLVPMNATTQIQQQPQVPHVAPPLVPASQTTQSVPKSADIPLSGNQDQRESRNSINHELLAKQQGKSVVANLHN